MGLLSTGSEATVWPRGAWLGDLPPFPYHRSCWFRRRPSLGPFVALQRNLGIWSSEHLVGTNQVLRYGPSTFLRVSQILIHVILRKTCKGYGRYFRIFCS